MDDPLQLPANRFQNKNSEAAIFKPLTLIHSSAEIIRCGGNVMARFFKKREKTKGLSPGSLVFVGNQKVLTIFAAIFIPLTFIAGIYGTNFEYLPELKFKYRYFVFWGVMLAVALVMLTFFRRKKWL